MDFSAGVYLPLPLLGFCLGWSSNFVGSQSGQVQSVKLLQNTAWSPPRTPALYSVYIFTLYLFTQRRGGGVRS
jgi:hypothetical protein